ILDTLPPGTRIVGSGPASLYGYFNPPETKRAQPPSTPRKPVPPFPQYELPRIQRGRSSRETNAAKLLAIGTASQDLFNQRGYPPAAISSENGLKFLTIHYVAVLLASYAGLTDAQAWFSPTDPHLPDSAEALTDVLDPATG